MEDVKSRPPLSTSEYDIDGPIAELTARYDRIQIDLKIESENVLEKIQASCKEFKDSFKIDKAGNPTAKETEGNGSNKSDESAPTRVSKQLDLTTLDTSTWTIPGNNVQATAPAPAPTPDIGKVQIDEEYLLPFEELKKAIKNPTTPPTQPKSETDANDEIQEITNLINKASIAQDAFSMSYRKEIVNKNEAISTAETNVRKAETDIQNKQSEVKVNEERVAQNSSTKQKADYQGEVRNINELIAKKEAELKKLTDELPTKLALVEDGKKHLEMYKKNTEKISIQMLDYIDKCNLHVRRLKNDILDSQKSIEAQKASNAINDRIATLELNDTAPENTGETAFGVILSNTIMKAFRKLYKEIKGEIERFISDFLHVYLHDIRKKNAYLKNARFQITERLKIRRDPDENDPISDKLTQKYTKNLESIKGLRDTEIKVALLVRDEINKIEVFIEKITLYITKKYSEKLDQKSNKSEMENKCKILTTLVIDEKEKLKKVYNNDITMLDIIMDNQFIALYVLKILQLGLIVGAIFLTEKIFSSMYMQKVYANNGDPPNLMIMLCIFVAIDFAFALFLVIVLYLVSLIAEKHGLRNFIINNDLIKKFMIDYTCSTVLLFILLSIITVYLQSKKYFRYKTEGLRAIRAFGDMAISIAPVILLVPFFAII